MKYVLDIVLYGFYYLVHWVWTLRKPPKIWTLEYFEFKLELRENIVEIIFTFYVLFIIILTIILAYNL